jgi:drug/metabolite transporter (DMT)-like permease
MVMLEWARPRGVRPRGVVLVGVVVGFVGLIILVGPDALTGRGPVDAVAAIVLVGASLAWAAGSVFNRHGARPESSAMSTGIQMLGGSVALILFGLIGGEGGRLHVTHISGESWLGLAYLVTFGSLIGFTAYIYLLKAVSSAKASTYAYVNPLVAVFLGWAIAGEPVTTRTLGAAAVILAGVAMISVESAAT